MRGNARTQSTMFHGVDAGDRIRPDHPLRAIREVVDPILAGLSPLMARIPRSPGGIKSG
jgi:hypothetical protein